MHLLYFFRQGSSQILHEKFEPVPPVNGAATPIFPFSRLFTGEYYCSRFNFLSPSLNILPYKKTF